MGYKTASAERSQATSAVSSAIAAFNNPDGTGFALTSTALTADKELKQYTVVAGTDPVNSATSVGGATITAVAITDSNYTVLDDTALATTGGYIELSGTGFKTGCVVYVAGTAATTTTFVSATKVRAVIGANSSNTLTIYLVNTDGSAAFYLTGLVASGVPAWSTGATLTATHEQIAYTQSLSATGDATISYSLKAGSNLPPGVALDPVTGLLSGTTPVIASGSTTYTFTIIASDGQNQDTERLFSLTINHDVVTWASPANNTTYTIYQNEAMSNVALNASSAAGKAITYTANTLPAGLSLSGSTLAGTPTTVASTTTLLTATAANTAATATNVINWIVSVSNDPYFKNTTLLLNGETAATNWITDASANSFNITPVSSVTIAKPTAFSPYNTSWSAYFDGTGDYLTTTGFGLPTNFTLEFWSYFTAQPSSGYFTSASSSGPIIGVESAKTILGWNGGWILNPPNDSAVYPNGVAPLNQWNHWAVVRSSGTIYFYLNGIKIGSAADSNNATASQTWGIGAASDGSGPINVPHYMSNFRMSSIARYSGTSTTVANFTLPTANFVSDANTLFLLLHSNRFKDGSTNNRAVTIYGDTAVRSYGPFVETDGVTGSGYFYSDDNNAYGNQYLQTSGGGINLTGTSTFTIEAWIYPRVRQAGARGVIIGDAQGAGGTENWSFGVTTAGLLNFYWYQTGVRNCTGSTTLPLNSWSHVAISISTGVIKLFVNGAVETLSGTTTTTAPGSSLGYYVIGKVQDTTYPFLGNITDLRVVTNTALYTVAFTPPTAPLTAIANTSLLTLQNRTGHNNNTVLDTSGNKLVGTKFGNATQGTFSPFSPAGWSYYFNGSSNTTAGAKLNTPVDATFALGTGDFTIELWAFLPSTGFITGGALFSMVGQTFILRPENSTFWRLYTPAGNIDYTPAVATNAWIHHAIVRNAGTTYYYQNGVLRGSIVDGTNYTATSFTLGDYSNYRFKGSLSNFRIVKGTAVYTAAFTSPTAALTAISGTILLTGQSNRVKDNSSNNFAIVQTNSTTGVVVQAYSPFDPVDAYTAANHIGSGYYDGTGDYHSFPLALTNVGNFTFEFWAYGGTNVSGTAFCGSSAFEVYLSGLNISWVYQGVIAFSSGINFIPNQWNHIVICRYNWVLNAAGLFKIFVNGQMYSHATAKGENFPIPGPFIIGGSYYNNAFRTPFPGYISNVRFVVGNGTIYTAAFTPPTAPVAAIAGTVLQLDFADSGIIDQTGKNNLETVGDARVSTAIKKYNSGSMYFDGTGDYLLMPSSANFELAGNFTIEFWMRPAAAAFGAGGKAIFSIGSTDPNTTVIRLNGAVLQFWINGSPSGITTCSTTNIAADTWYHVALVRNGTGTNNVKLYLNGVQDGTFAAARNEVIVAAAMAVGRHGATQDVGYYTGYVDDLRITQGVARYTANFTPPTESFKLK